METTKITVKIYEPLLRDFDRQIDALFIKRDAFLNAMLREELPRLKEDVAGRRNSAAAKRHISGELKRLGTRSVNVVVDKATSEALNAIVEESNIVRDAFVNRLIMMLRSSSQLLRWLDLPEFITGSAYSGGVEPMPTSPMKALESVHSDPLYYLRAACEERHGTGLYLIDLPAKLAGFACVLDDSMVPGTKAHEEAAREAEEMLSALASLEDDAFGGAGKGKE